MVAPHILPPTIIKGRSALRRMAIVSRIAPGAGTVDDGECYGPLMTLSLKAGGMVPVGTASVLPAAKARALNKPASLKIILVTPLAIYLSIEEDLSIVQV
jgi:hypothetical protein